MHRVKIVKGGWWHGKRGLVAWKRGNNSFTEYYAYMQSLSRLLDGAPLRELPCAIGKAVSFFAEQPRVRTQLTHICVED
jgi:hypothetical protein